MARRAPSHVVAARARVVAARTKVIARYEDGESAAALGREFNVNPEWLARQLAEWGVAIRDRAAAAIARGAGVPPMGD